MEDENLVPTAVTSPEDLLLASANANDESGEKLVPQDRRSDVRSLRSQPDDDSVDSFVIVDLSEDEEAEDDFTSADATRAKGTQLVATRVVRSKTLVMANAPAKRMVSEVVPRLTTEEPASVPTLVSARSSTIGALIAAVVRFFRNLFS